MKKNTDIEEEKTQNQAEQSAADGSGNVQTDQQSEEMNDAGPDEPQAEASGEDSAGKEAGRKFFRRKEDKKKDGVSARDRKIESLESELAGANARLAETNDKYIRLAAEFDNYRRRTAKERLELISSAGEDVLKGLLPTLDDCEKALDMLSKLEGCDAAVEGTRLIYDKLTSYLKSRGVNRMEALGADFDTDLHEAVAQFPVPEEEKKNKVIDVVRQGYKLKDKVIRYAQVVVGI